MIRLPPRLSILSLILLSGWTTSLLAQATVLDPVFDGEVRVRSLESGLRIVLARVDLPDSISSRAFVGVYTPYGTDRERIPGLAHFAEHIYSNMKPGIEDFVHPEDIEYYDSNAMTRPDYISVWNTVSGSAAVPRILGRSAGLWSRTDLTELAERQLERVRAELDRSRGSQSYAAIRAVDQLFYGNRPSFDAELRNAGQISIDSLNIYLDAAYTPATSVLVVAGDIDIDRVESELISVLSRRPVPAGPAAGAMGRFFREVGEVAVPPKHQNDQVLELGSPDFKGFVVTAGFAAPPRDSMDYLAMIVLDQLLLGGRREFDELWHIERDVDGILGRRLSERIQIESLSDARGYGAASPPLAETTPAQFRISFYVDYGERESLIGALDSALHDVYEHDLTEAALTTAKSDLADFYRRWLRHRSLRPLGDHLAGLSMYDEAGPERLFDLHREIDAVTLAEIRVVMEEYILEGDRRIGVARFDPDDLFRRP